jgi:hypothetical protein
MENSKHVVLLNPVRQRGNNVGSVILDGCTYHGHGRRSREEGLGWYLTMTVSIPWPVILRVVSPNSSDLCFSGTT